MTMGINILEHININFKYFKNKNHKYLIIIINKIQKNNQDIKKSLKDLNNKT